MCIDSSAGVDCKQLPAHPNAGFAASSFGIAVPASNATGRDQSQGLPGSWSILAAIDLFGLREVFIL